MASRPEPRKREVFKPTNASGESVRYTREFFLDKPDEFWASIVAKVVEKDHPDVPKIYFHPMRAEENLMYCFLCQFVFFNTLPWY